MLLSIRTHVKEHTALINSQKKPRIINRLERFTIGRRAYSRLIDLFPGNCMVTRKIRPWEGAARACLLSCCFSLFGHWKAAAYEWLPKIRAIYSIYNGNGSTTRSINAGKKEREKGIGICIASFMAWRADGALESVNHKDDATASSDLRWEKGA